MDLRPVVIYHANCADGVGAAWCFWRIYGDFMEYVPGIYQDAIGAYEGREIYFVDFSAPRNIMEQIVKVAKKVTLLDHHITAIDAIRGLKGVCMEHCTTEKSGAGIAWEYLNPGKELPQVLAYIQDRDLWQFKNSNTKDFMAWFFAHDVSIQLVEQAHQILLSRLQPSILEQGRKLRQKHERDVESVCEQCVRDIEIAGYWVPVANANGWLASDVGSKLAEGKPFAATYFDTAAGRSWSLRSSDAGVDVGAIARLFGGGGHRNAAGFKVTRYHTLALV